MRLSDLCDVVGLMPGQFPPLVGLCFLTSKIDLAFFCCSRSLLDLV